MTPLERSIRGNKKCLFAELKGVKFHRSRKESRGADSGGGPDLCTSSYASWRVDPGRLAIPVGAAANFLSILP